MSDEASLKNIVERLDQIITLLKITNIDALKKIKSEINSDYVSKTILQLADGSRDYSTLSLEVSKITSKSDRTVKDRISELSEKGAIRGVRKGRSVFYENTSLYD